ncbi:response regulator [Embleya sp. AB8]|uniref:response regulator n=1 Tax=Embleya sp. AB8 TaxID=3156304 RepID=UPI003C721086
MTVRVLIADDQTLVRTGFRAIVGLEPDLEVVGEAADGIEAVEAARRLRPDVVLMDVRMPRLDGVAATRAIVGTGADERAPRVLVLTTFDLDEYVVGALRAGASGYLLKDSPADRLLDGIRVVAAGDAMLAPAVTRRLLERVGPAAAPPDDEGRALRSLLTARELDVLLSLAQGRSNAEIAAALVLRETTVKSHVQGILAKLGLRDRLQAVIAAYDAGLVRPRGFPARPDDRA